MPWHLTEFLLKGTYLGLLVALGLSKPSWPQIALAGACMIGGLLLALGSVAVAKLRQGYRQIHGCRRLSFAGKRAGH